MPLDFCLLAANAALCYNVARCAYATLDLDLALDLVGRLAANPTSAKAPLVGSKESQGAVIQLSHNALERRGMSVLGREHGLRALIALKLCPALAGLRLPFTRNSNWRSSCQSTKFEDVDCLRLARQLDGQ